MVDHATGPSDHVIGSRSSHLRSYAWRSPTSPTSRPLGWRSMRCRSTSPGRWVRIRLGAGLAFGAFAVSALVCAPSPAGSPTSGGAGRCCSAARCSAAVALFLTALVDSLATIVLLRLLVGVAEAAFFVASFAVLADLAPPSRMGEALSYNSLGLYLGLSFGPPLGEVMVDTWGFAAAWFGAGALAAAAVVVLGIGETRSPRSEQRCSTPVDPLEGGAGIDRLLHLDRRHRRIPRLRVLARRRVGLASTSLPLFVYGAVVVIGRIVFAKVPDRVPALPLGAAAWPPSPSASP